MDGWISFKEKKARGLKRNVNIKITEGNEGEIFTFFPESISLL